MGGVNENTTVERSGRRPNKNKRKSASTYFHKYPSYREDRYSEQSAGDAATGSGDRAVVMVDLKADDTVSALKVRQLGTQTWDAHPTKRKRKDSPCAEPLCDTSMLVDGPLP